MGEVSWRNGHSGHASQSEEWYMSWKGRWAAVLKWFIRCCCWLEVRLNKSVATQVGQSYGNNSWQSPLNHGAFITDEIQQWSPKEGPMLLLAGEWLCFSRNKEQFIFCISIAHQFLVTALIATSTAAVESWGKILASVQAKMLWDALLSKPLMKRILKQKLLPFRQCLVQVAEPLGFCQFMIPSFFLYNTITFQAYNLPVEYVASSFFFFLHFPDVALAILPSKWMRFLGLVCITD